MNIAKDPVTELIEVSDQRISEAMILNEKKFYPTGAIAFFVALVILCLVIWFGIYFIMLDRV